MFSVAFKYDETYGLISPHPPGPLQTLVSHQPGSIASAGSRCRQSSLHSVFSGFSLKKSSFFKP